MPAGAPKEVKDVLAGALKKIITSEEFKTQMEKLSYAPMYMDPKAYLEFWVNYETQGQKWVDWSKESSKDAK
jgi:tripartite-type tricarboxylate transporter receptor subunit TctC